MDENGGFSWGAQLITVVPLLAVGLLLLWVFP